MHGVVDGMGVWLPLACPCVWAIRREYNATLVDIGS